MEKLEEIDNFQFMRERISCKPSMLQGSKIRMPLLLRRGFWIRNRKRAVLPVGGPIGEHCSFFVGKFSWQERYSVP